MVDPLQHACARLAEAVFALDQDIAASADSGAAELRRAGMLESLCLLLEVLRGVPLVLPDQAEEVVATEGAARFRARAEEPQEQEDFVTLFSRFGGAGGFLTATVRPDGTVVIRTDRWEELAGEGGTWFSGEASFRPWGPAFACSLSVHEPSEFWRGLGSMAPWEAARDFERMADRARTRAARRLREWEEALRRARYAVWTSPGDAAAREAVEAEAEAELAARGGDPGMIWPNLVSTDEGGL